MKSGDKSLPLLDIVGCIVYECVVAEIDWTTPSTCLVP
jgi:hypothetical protein